MSVQKTDKAFFDKVSATMSKQRKMANLLFSEEEYLKTTNEERVAVILKSKRSSSYGYVLLKRDDTNNKYKLEEGNSSFKSHEEAKTAVETKMANGE